MSLSVAAEYAVGTLDQLHDDERQMVAAFAGRTLKKIRDAYGSSGAERNRAELFLAKGDKLFGSVPGNPFSDQTADSVSFYGVVSQGKRIVLIIDYTNDVGEMSDFEFQYIQVGLTQFVKNVSPNQEFAIVLAGNTPQLMLRERLPKLANGKLDLLHPSDGIRAECLAAILKVKPVRILPNGPDDQKLRLLSQAFRSAFDLNPDVIYFMTYINFNPDLTQKVNEMNRGGKVVINTLGIRNSAEEDDESLIKLATANRGKFKYVSIKESSAFILDHASDLAQPKPSDLPSHPASNEPVIPPKPTAQDVIKTKDGRVFRGHVVDEGDTYLIEQDLGKAQVKKADVEEFKRATTP